MTDRDKIILINKLTNELKSANLVHCVLCNIQFVQSAWSDEVDPINHSLIKYDYKFNKMIIESSLLTDVLDIIVSRINIEMLFALDDEIYINDNNSDIVVTKQLLNAYKKALGSEHQDQIFSMINSMNQVNIELAIELINNIN